MIGDFFTTVFFEPLYNGLVWLINITPDHNLALAIVILTLVVKGILLPLTHKSSKSNAKMRQLEPEIQKIRDTHKKDQQIQAQKVMALYQEHGINPFSGCLLTLVQLPVFIALYYVFFKGLPTINVEALYSFVVAPEYINVHLLGFIDLTGKSAVLALLAGLSQYYQMQLALPPAPAPKTEEEKKGEPNFQAELSRTMGTQMRYILPVLITVIAWTISAAIALYFVVSNIFSIIHELFVKREASALLSAKNTEST
jgi:YidC/Oxa1 family membrane protein insertase